jgi:hypothetical protein
VSCGLAGVDHLFAALPVSDLAAAVAFQERLHGRPPDLVPNDVEACWQVRYGAWLYVIVDAERAGAGLVTLLVEDLDSFLADVSGRGLSAGPVEPVGPAGRQVVLGDPDGNRVKVAQVRD